jgi:hypothetical protein
VQVDYTTQDGTARAGVDYVATSGTLLFAPDQTTATISVPIIGNTVFQSDRTFDVVLSDPQSSAAFANPQTFPATGNLVIADFNGDGKPDLALSNFHDNTVSVLLNTTPSGAATVSFTVPQTFATGRGPIAIAAGDFNGDGKPDLAVANLDDTISVLLNTTPPRGSTPSFTAQQPFPIAVGSVSDVAVGDFNGDGKPDLVAVGVDNGAKISVLLNTTAPGADVPSFAAQQVFDAGDSLFYSHVAVADFNGDGKPDLAVTNTGHENAVSVLLNTTATGSMSLSFTDPVAFATGRYTRSVVVEDFNGDGKPDLATANGGDTVSVLLNTTTLGSLVPAFSPQQVFSVTSDPESLAVGDFNGDGKPDLVVANRLSDWVSVLLNTTAAGSASANFTPQQTFTTGMRHNYLVAVADLNGDGNSDLAVVGDSPTGVVLLNTVTPITIMLVSDSSVGTIQDDDAPVTIAIGAGNNQSTSTNTAFATNLAVDVRNAAGNLVQGASVTFVAPTGGPSGTFSGGSSITVVTDASGRATAPTFTANAVAGSFTVLTEAAGGSGPSTSFSLSSTIGSNHAPVLDPIPDMGLSLNRSLTFTARATDPDSPPETLTFSLDPGAPVSAHIDPLTGVFTVSNLKLGTYTITVRVTDNGNPPLSAAQTFHVFVAPQVKDITLNDGSIKNPTAVTFLTVTFNARVNIDSGAFELTRLGSGGGPVGVTIASINVIDGKTVVTLQFGGSFVLPNGSLMSGQYALTTHGSLIHDAVTGLALDGDNNGLPGGDNLFRFIVP